MKCFIGRLRNHNKIYGIDGIIGLAPLVDKLKEYSFLEQMKKKLAFKDEKFLGMVFNFSRDSETDLGLFQGNISFTKVMDENKWID